MARQIPTKEPAELTAGDLWDWTRSLGDYPADDSWVLTYAMVDGKNGNKITITATADGADHKVSVAKATTADYEPGDYSVQGYVTKSTERYQVFSGTIKVLPDLAAVSASYDHRSHAKKVLDAIEAVIEGRASKEILTHSLQGINIQTITHADLLAMRNAYRIEYQRELEKDRIKKELGTGRRVKVQFTK